MVLPEHDTQPSRLERLLPWLLAALVMTLLLVLFPLRQPIQRAGEEYAVARLGGVTGVTRNDQRPDEVQVVVDEHATREQLRDILAASTAGFSVQSGNVTAKPHVAGAAGQAPGAEALAEWMIVMRGLPVNVKLDDDVTVVGSAVDPEALADAVERMPDPAGKFERVTLRDDEKSIAIPGAAKGLKPAMRHAVEYMEHFETLNIITEGASPDHFRVVTEVRGDGDAPFDEFLSQLWSIDDVPWAHANVAVGDARLPKLRFTEDGVAAQLVSSLVPLASFDDVSRVSSDLRTITVSDPALFHDEGLLSSLPKEAQRLSGVGSDLDLTDLQDDSTLVGRLQGTGARVIEVADDWLHLSIGDAADGSGITEALLSIAEPTTISDGDTAVRFEPGQAPVLLSVEQSGPIAAAANRWGQR